MLAAFAHSGEYHNRIVDLETGLAAFRSRPDDFVHKHKIFNEIGIHHTLQRHKNVQSSGFLQENRLRKGRDDRIDD